MGFPIRQETPLFRIPCQMYCSILSIIKDAFKLKENDSRFITTTIILMAVVLS